MQRGFAGDVAPRRARDDCRRVELIAVAPLVLGRHARPGQVGLDAAGTAAIAGGQGQVILTGQRQRVVAPFAGDGVGTADQPAAHDEAATDAGADDHGEHHLRARAGAIRGFGHREAVGVVRQAQRPLQQRLQVLLQRLAVEAGGVGVADQAGDRRQRAGRADADAGPEADGALGVLNQAHDRPQRGLVVTLRRRHAASEAFTTVLVERDQLDLGATQVDADAHVATAMNRQAMRSTAPR